MPFYLVQPKTKMICGICRKSIDNTEFLFQSKIILEGVKYPLNRNICMQCAKKVRDADFVDSLKKILDDVLELQKSFTNHKPEKDF